MSLMIPVFITEAQEPDLAVHIGRALKVSESTRRDLRISDFVVQLDREHEEESYRKRTFNHRLFIHRLVFCGITLYYHILHSTAG